MKDHAMIALEHASGNISRMQFGTFRRRAQLDPQVASVNGFVLSEDEGHWHREATDDLVTREIAKTQWSDDIGPVVKWWRIKDGDPLPPRSSPPAKVIPLPTKPLPDDMAAHLNAFSQRVEQRLAEVSRDMAAAKGSDDSGARLEAVEGQLAALMETFKGLKR